MNKKIVRISTALLVVLLLTAALAGCEMGLPWNTALWGTWDAGDAKIIVDNTSYSVVNPESWNWDYSGKVVEFNNSAYNIAAETPASVTAGYLVLEITEHSHTDGKDQIGTFTVVRWRNWQNSDGKVTVEYSEAFPAGWKTADEAVKSACEADNFKIYKPMTKSAVK